MKRLVASILLVLASVSAQAQFSITGSSPGGTRWMQMETPSFRIIYPAGEDSLARAYGRSLENARTMVSWSSGLQVRKGMPVVLHSFNTSPNASVTWVPRRMDMYTVPDAYSPTPIRWDRCLSLHEGRHAAQMTALESGRNRVFSYILGEMFAGSLAGIYPGSTLLEGDAVVSETALTSSGRGRQAAFLSYFKPAFDSGDWRDFWRWSYGSDRLYTPDHYKPGYMLVSGMRVFYDDPLFTKEYFDRVKGRGLFSLLPRTVREASGAGLKKTFRAISEKYHAIWEEEALSQGPFIPARQVSAPSWRHASYEGTVFAEGLGLVAKQAGLTIPGTLVAIGADGSRTALRAFSSRTGKLVEDPAGGRIYWSESIPHWRWTLASSSRIRYIETGNPSKVRDLTKEGKYFNPAPSPDGSMVCVAEYPPEGGSLLVFLRTGDGGTERVVPAPDTLQVTESAWVGNRLFLAGLSNSGMGIYEYSGHGFAEVLAPRPVTLSTLRPFGPCGPSILSEALSFVCDRTGTDELYVLDVDTRVLRQATSTRYGIGSPVLGPGADTLYYSSLAPSDRPEAFRQGRMIYSTAVADLPMKEVSFSDLHPYAVADAMTEQEKALAGEGWAAAGRWSETSFSEPRKFRKMLPRVHSWAPVYFDYDNVENLSLDDYNKMASLGATVLFQNLTGDGYGSIGYSARLDESEDRSFWRHSAHLKYLYEGFLPVIDFSFDIGDRYAMEFSRILLDDRTKNTISVFTSSDGSTHGPRYEGILKLYVPVNLSSGGFSRGLVPQVRYKFSNDLFNDHISLMEAFLDDGKRVTREIGHVNTSKIARLSSLDLSMRGYVMRDKAPSQTFPRLGIGAEAGFHSRPGNAKSYSNTVYLYTYGYLPGILQDQGLKLTATVGSALGGDTYSFPDMSVSFLPRGFADTNIRQLDNVWSPSRFKFTVDYSIPFLHLDWSGIAPVAYVKHLELTPFFDYSCRRLSYGKDFAADHSAMKSVVMTSAGADLAVILGNLAWLPFETSVGVRYARNGWDKVDRFPVTGLGKDYFGFIFNVSM